MGPLYFIQKREKDVILQEVYRNIGQFSTDWTSLFPMMVLGILPLLVSIYYAEIYYQWCNGGICKRMIYGGLGMEFIVKENENHQWKAL